MKFSNVKFAPDVITDAPIAQAVAASCAFPVVFRPRAYGEFLLSDGGTLDNLPVECLPGLGADVAVGVRFSQNDKKEKFKDSHHKNIINIADRSLSILRSNIDTLTDTNMDFCFDVDIENTSLLEMRKLGECYDAGYETCRRDFRRMLIKM